ncbi:MAG TPA: replication factor C large subunit [Methanoregulaceae archaeon]|nr:replication factor C large subunit [Methanoregulaceae archaeon]
MDWAEKYRPRRLEDLVGNTTAIRRMAEWAQSWTRESKPLILYGKPGTGKTSSALALANQMNWEVVELNASDQRTKAVIEKIAGTSSMTRSLSGASRKLILLDEADNLQGTADRGGARAILDVIRNTRQPIILIANEMYELSPELRSRCEGVLFRALPARSIVPRLRHICSAECIECSEEVLKEIAVSAGGDMRAAITMLYASAAGKNRLTEDELYTSGKDGRATIFDLVSAIFGSPSGEKLLQISYEVDETPETVEQWIESNLHHLKNPDKIAQGYQFLSSADEYIGYTYRQQYYRLWRYATAMMVLGVSSTAEGRGLHARIMPPTRWKKMGTYKKQKSLRLGLFQKLSNTLHIPRHTIRDEYMSPLSMIVEHDPHLYAREFSLDADELNLFLQDRGLSQEVIKAIRKEEREAENEKKKKSEFFHGTMKKDKEKQEKSKTAERDVQSLSGSRDKEEDITPPKSQKTLFEGF